MRNVDPSRIERAPLPRRLAVAALGVLCFALPASGAEASWRRDQIEYLEGVVERHAVTTVEANEALVGALVLRDDDPAGSARCGRALAGASPDAARRHEAACAHCGSMLALLSGGAEEAPAPVTPTPGARDLTREARSLVADPFGYVHAGAARPATAERALALLERALEESPDYGLALQLYGILNELRERPALADAAFRQAVHAAPEGAWSLNNVALFYWRQGLLRHSYYVLMLALERYRDPRTARLLAHLHRAPGGADLVPAAEACTLIEWVLRTYPEPSHEKTVADRDYHRELCAQLARTRA